MVLFFGLGNPDKKYLDSRHNLGRKALEHFAEDALPEKTWQKKPALLSRVIKSRYLDKDILLASGLVAMNRSGEAVRRLADYYDVPAEKIVIVHDDVDLSLGKIKIAFNQRSGGHRGVASVEQQLGTRAFGRIKLGTWNWKDFPRKKKEITERIILTPFAAQERPLVREALERFVQAMAVYIKKLPCPALPKGGGESSRIKTRS